MENNKIYLSDLKLYRRELDPESEFWSTFFWSKSRPETWSGIQILIEIFRSKAWSTKMFYRMFDRKLGQSFDRSFDQNHDPLFWYGNIRFSDFSYYFFNFLIDNMNLATSGTRQNQEIFEQFFFYFIETINT